MQGRLAHGRRHAGIRAAVPEAADRPLERLRRPAGGEGQAALRRCRQQGGEPARSIRPTTGSIRFPAPATRGRWQVDAHGFARSSGDRLLSPDDLVGSRTMRIYKLFRDHSLGAVYDFEHHVAIAARRSRPRGACRRRSCCCRRTRWHPDVWTDVARMRTLNMLQAQQGREMHLCPLQFDIVDRLIAQFSMPGETVFDPFAGLMTVPVLRAQAQAQGLGIELNPRYFRDGVALRRSRRARGERADPVRAAGRSASGAQ